MTEAIYPRHLRGGHQIHREQDFDRPRGRRSHISNPSLRIQFHAPVRYQNIRGPYHLSIQLEAPAVVWGPGGRCWAFLHDFTSDGIDEILTDYRDATYERRGLASWSYSDSR